ncbi:MAG: 16S rRNA (uracil(1498)-N(3))-methyltransferase [Bacteroidales bacterium]|nr:16S rRNA (uracil(1498)-N(3))-methyltransferase [Bacteroidales bacterium]
MSISNYFYAPDINGHLHTLNKDDSGHLVRVLRMQKGETVFVTNGKGTIFECLIVDPDPKNCQIEIIQKKSGDDQRDFTLQIAIAPTKNISRFEWFLEKSTEIGIDIISPILSEHSERKIIKPERLNRVMTAAVKQSLKSFHPELNTLTNFEDFIKTHFSGQKFIAYVDANVKDELLDVCKPSTNTLILIGPEGDFSEKEIENARNNGFTPVKLGPSRLRTETAGIVACHTVHMVNLS